MREKYGAKNPKSWMLRFHSQTAGSTLTAQEPLNNVVRTTLQALAAVLGNVYPVCTGGNYHLKAEFENGDIWIGQSRITSQPHPPIRRGSMPPACGAFPTLSWSRAASTSSGRTR